MGLLGKVLYALNVLVALGLFFSFLLPYVPPKSFPSISVLSLLVSPLIVINLLFLLYWLLRFNRRFLMSFSVLIVTFFYFNPFYQFSSEKKSASDKQFSVLSFNVRLFNAYEEKPLVKASEVFQQILTQQSPDVLCIQEYYTDNDVDFSAYRYQFIHFEGNNKLGHAIFSKYPLLHTGAFDFKNSNNNAVYADVLVGKDTLRVFNLHLESIGIKPSVSSLEKSNKEKLIKRIGGAFAKQQDQALLVKKEVKASPHPVLLAGDFNNTPFSYVYKMLLNGMKDAFVEAGNGLGTTYNFDSYPMRIDYIFSSPDIEIVNFQTLSYTSSDHYPIYALVEWE